MATEASPPKKHKASRGTALKGKKKKHSKANKESTGKSHKSRSLSELVELVSTGAIQIPQSLMSYAEDRSQLLDQIFSILTSDDIKEMLPDALKGCKIKHVRLLCCEQLKKMSSEEITDILRPAVTCEHDVKVAAEVTAEAVLNKRTQDPESDMECEQVAGMESEQAAGMESEQNENFSDISDGMSPEGSAVSSTMQAEDRIVVMPDVSGDELDDELTQRDALPVHNLKIGNSKGSPKCYQHSSRDRGTASKGGHGTKSSRDHGTASKGGHGTKSSRDRGTASKGGHGTKSSRDHGTASKGGHGTKSSRDRGTASKGAASVSVPKLVSPSLDIVSSPPSRDGVTAPSPSHAQHDVLHRGDHLPSASPAGDMRDVLTNKDVLQPPSGVCRLPLKEVPSHKHVPSSLPKVSSLKEVSATSMEVSATFQEVPPCGTVLTVLKQASPTLKEVPLSTGLIVESAQLVEMELRKRALESELKRAKKDDRSLPQPGNLGDLESLEMKLRQRALQSLLAKKEAV